MSSVTVIVPATTANLGPGFDCIGAALTLYNEFKFIPTESEVKITVIGEEASKVSLDKDNLLYQCFVQLYQRLGQTPPNIEVEINVGVPLARGLGSSATAIVGGLVGANQLAGNPLSRSELKKLAIAIEGHPDNVVPALLGGCQLSIGEQVCSIPWHQDIIPIVAIPEFELSTKVARSVLPGQLSYRDSIFNISRMGLLIRGLETGQKDWLTLAMEDKLHQPYRKRLIQGYDRVKQAAISAGAYGMVISGAGPTLLALTHTAQAQNVVVAMKEAWKQAGVTAQVRSLSLDSEGAKIM